MSMLDGLTVWFAKVQLTSQRRIEFYETVRTMLENGIKADDFFLELHDVWSEGGKKLDEPLPMLAKACHTALASGDKFSTALAEWVPAQEAAMVATGERVGSLVETLGDVIRLIEYKQRIMGAVAAAAAYPVILSIVLSFLLYQVAAQLVPQILSMSSPDALTPALYLLYLLSKLVTEYGVYIVIFLALLGVFISWSLPRLTGAVRVQLDKLPIYSTYRILHGSTFLLNIAVMMKSGEYLKDALQTLSDNANDWMYERINGALLGINSGLNLGASLDQAGHSFPDKRSIQMLIILSGKTQFEGAMIRFATRWVEQTIKRIENIAKTALLSSIFIIFLIVGLVFLGVQDMQTLIDSKINSQQL